MDILTTVVALFLMDDVLIKISQVYWLAHRLKALVNLWKLKMKSGQNGENKRVVEWDGE